MLARVERVNKKNDKQEIMTKELENIINNPNELLTFAEIAKRYDMTEDSLGLILIDSCIMYKNIKGNWITRNINAEIQGYVHTIYREEGEEFVQYFTTKGRLLIHSILAGHGYIAMMDKELIRQGYEPDTTPLLSLE